MSFFNIKSSMFVYLFVFIFILTLQQFQLCSLADLHFWHGDPFSDTAADIWTKTAQNGPVNFPLQGFWAATTLYHTLHYSMRLKELTLVYSVQLVFQGFLLCPI